MNDDAPEVIVCVGPPQCLLEDEEAVENAQAGCHLCRRIKVAPDGAEAEYQKKPN